MTIKAMCFNCNEFLNSLNESFTLDAFWFEHYKTRYCTNKIIGLDGEQITCLIIYAERVKYYSLPFRDYNQPERSKREDCARCKKLQEPLNSCCFIEISQMRCSEHCGNTVSGK